MRFSSHSRAGALLSLTVLLTLVGAFFTYSTLGNHAVHAAAAAASFKGTAGVIKVAGTTDPMHLAPGKASKRVARVAPLRTIAKGVGPNNVSRPVTNSSRLAAARLLHSFDGVNELQNAAASNTPLEPPDEGLGVGNGYVFNIVNVTGAIYRTDGTGVTGPFSATSFFAEPANAFLSDPRTFYDKATNTWFATILEINFTTGSESHIDIAVNPSGNPTTPWTVYRIDATDPTGAGCPCFPDYPIFGIDQYNVYVSAQEFPITGAGNGNGAEIYAVSKAQLEALKPANNVRFGSLSIAGQLAYHVQPAISYGNPAAEYFMDSLDPNSTFDNRLGVWALTNRQAVTTGIGLPNLSSTVIASEAYGFPVNAQTPPGFNSYSNAATTGLVQSDFDAMQEVEYINGHLVGALNTSVTIPGDTGTRDGVAWFQVAPKLSGAVISGSTRVTQQGYVSVQGEYLLYPHINQSADGTTAMTFSLGGPNTYLSAAYAVKGAGSANFGSVQIAGAGVAPDNGFTGVGGAGRWGDYSAGQLDPNSNNIWFATQYIPNNGDQFANWGNRVFEVGA